MTLHEILNKNAKYATKEELEKLIIIFVDISKGEHGVKTYTYKRLLENIKYNLIDENEQYKQHTWKGGFTIVLCK